MSESEKFTTNTIKLYRTSDHNCSYLENKKSRTLFLDPDLNYSVFLYEELTHSGFRRSGKHLYRPDCKECQSCIPARIPVKDFMERRRHRRILNLNEDLTLLIDSPKYRHEDFELFEKYIALRHADGDMYPATESGYRDFLATENEFTFHIRMFLGDRLVAVAVTDRLNTGLSAIYTFYDPDLESRSLGVFGVLSQLELCRKWELPYLYLGYWVPGCRKMQYKTQYKPTELLFDGRWQLIEHESITNA